MARTSTPSQAAPDHQQMLRPQDEDEARRMDEAAPELAMESRRQRFAGSAAGVGSVGFDEAGAYDVGVSDVDPQDAAITDNPPPPSRS